MGRRLTAAVVLASALALAGVPAGATSSLERTIVLPSASSPLVALNAYLAGGSSANGITGWVFPTGGKTTFKLERVSGATSMEEFDIYFYDNPQIVGTGGGQLGLAASCGKYTGPSPVKTGAICGTHAVVVMWTGLNGRFRYTAS